MEIVNLGGEPYAEPAFEVYKDKTGQYRFRLKAANGEIIAAGEAYSSKEACLNGIKSIKKNAPKAKIVILDDKVKEEKVVEPKAAKHQKKSEERRAPDLGVFTILLVIIIFMMLMLITGVIK